MRRFKFNSNSNISIQYSRMLLIAHGDSTHEHDLSYLLLVQQYLQMLLMDRRQQFQQGVTVTVETGEDM